ncbi:response regulator [bacterium]|nr:response regulator [bacterium]
MTKRLSSLLGQFGDVAGRQALSARLARTAGADDLYILIREEGSQRFTPAHGYQLQMTRAWELLLEEASRLGSAEAEMQELGTSARAYVRADTSLVLLGGSEPRPQTLLDLLPLLGSLARAELNGQSAERSEFLSYANHEIRTPMAAMLGYVDILLRQSRQPDERHYLEIIQRNGLQLLETINDLFDLSRIRMQNLPVDSRLFELPPLIAEIRNQVEPLAQERGLNLQVYFDTLVPRRLTSDPARLRQILMNLLSNAIKYTERGWVRLSLRAQTDWLEFTVADTGVGLDPDRLPQLLQTQSIGLSITHKLIGLLGGKLAVQSTATKGTRFCFRLPASCDELVDGNIELLTASVTASQLPDLAGLSVLVVDDREDIQEIARAFLEAAGATVYTTGSGQTALEFLKKKTVSVIILDMHMPTMDGHETARTLRSQGISTPILALTASTMSGQDCLESGCNAYLSKPVDRSSLIGQVWTLAYSLQVLVVEDSPLAAHALQALLQSMGCNVRVAHNGAETQQQVLGEAPKVVLMDLGLPDIDGWALLAWLRQNCPEARVLAHTGRRFDEMQSPIAGLSFDGYLQKPAARTELLKSLFPRVTASVTN